MAITTSFSSDSPINTCLDILKEHTETYLDGAVHDTVQFPEAVVYLERKELEPPLTLTHARIQIIDGEDIEKINGNLVVRPGGTYGEPSHHIRQKLTASISVMTSMDTVRKTGDTNLGLGELISSEMKDVFRSLIFHRYVGLLQSAGLDEFDVGIPINIPHSQLWIWNLVISFVVRIEQVLL